MAEKHGVCFFHIPRYNRDTISADANVMHLSVAFLEEESVYFLKIPRIRKFKIMLEIEIILVVVDMSRYKHLKSMRIVSQTMLYNMNFINCEI